MEDNMKGLKRTHYCGEVTEIGKEVVVGGFVDRIRNKGSVIFIVLRDRSGVVQLTFNDKSDPNVFEKASSCKMEYVLMGKGKVIERESKNDKLQTGNVEIFVNDLRILSKAQTLPFEITDKVNINEELRLKYRYLDLRRASLQKNIIIRHEIARVTREYFYENGFLEIETPMMMKSTPEGARDYLIPSRVHKGKFYALPQSPQIYKQLLMIAGYDRYIQLARCFRDEDLRADRQPEFTQIDFEMSFVDPDDIQNCVERFIKCLFKKVINVDIFTPFPKITFDDAINHYGSDKPDTRFGFEIQDITDTVNNIDFFVFKSAIDEGGSVRAINVKGGAATYTYKKINKLIDQAKCIGAKGLMYIRWVGEPNCSFNKFIDSGDLEKICDAVSANDGDLIIICADKTKTVLSTLGAIRLICGKRLGVIDEKKYNFVWITEMPFFEFDEDKNTWGVAHHPFTMPMEECIEYLDNDPENVRAKAWDLVLNGTELASGSMRITDCTLQQKMFEILGMTEKDIQTKFGFLVDAYHYAAPPHGGMGIGLDRIAMIMCKAENLRDVTAFPKVQNASELMSECPSTIDNDSLNILGINVIAK